jgi:hypothetical protein
MAQYLDSFEEFNRIKNTCHRLIETNKTIPDMFLRTTLIFIILRTITCCSIQMDRNGIIS